MLYGYTEFTDNECRTIGSFTATAGLLVLSLFLPLCGDDTVLLLRGRC